MAHASVQLLSMNLTAFFGTSAAVTAVGSTPKAQMKCFSPAAPSSSFSLTASVTSATRMTLVTEGRLGGQGGGTGVLERPGLDQSSPDTAPRTEEGGEMGKSRQTVRFGGGDRYRVLLLDHERHTESHVAKVIPQVVPSVSPDEARKCFHESREFGFGLVTIAVREHAEFYVQMLSRYGLRSTMEQDSTVA